MAKGAAVASLLVSIGADISGLQSGGKEAAKSMQDLGKHARDLGNKMAALGAAAVAAGAAMVAGLTKAGLESIDAQAKLARGIGSTIDGLRALQLATSEAGVSNEDLAANMQKFNARLGEAQRGTGKAKEALDTLGLSAASLAQMDVDQRMATVADRIQELGLSSSQTADVLKNMGIKNGEMVDIMRNGGDVIRTARDDVQAFGLSLSAIDAAKVEAANDAMGRIGLVMESVQNHLAVAFAPMLQELADRFNNLAKENKGFGEQAVRAVERVGVVIGWLADGLQAIRILFKGLQLVAEGFAGAFYSAAQGVIEIVAGISDVVAKELNVTIRGLNQLGASIDEIPLLDKSEFMASVRRFADGSRERVGMVRSELHDLAMQELPSDKIKKFFENTRAAADEAAKAVVAAQPGGGTFESEDEESTKEREKQAKLLEAQREALAEKLNQVIEFAATEDEIATAQHEERMETLRASLEEELITEEEFHIAKQLLEEKHGEKMAELRRKGMTAMEKFTQMSFADQAKTVAEGLANMTAALSRDSRTMFEINKVAGIANATVAMFQGIAEGLKLGWPMAVPAVAYAVANGAAAIAGIKKQSFGSGATPSVSGTTAATPVTSTGNSTSQSSSTTGGSLLTVEGVSADALFSGRTVRALAERLAEHQRDGGTVQFA